MNDSHFKFSPSVLVFPLFSVVLLWFVFWFEIRFHFDFSQWGIQPRTLKGLRGVLFSPFIHGNIEHLYNNSLPLFLLVAALRFFYRAFFFKILGFGIIFSGWLTWIIGSNSFHIGASGLIYVLVSFVFFKGITTKYYRLIALSLLVVMLYGSLVWYVFPNVKEGISWEGHLAGFFTGFVFAFIFKSPVYRKAIKYDWEHPDFNAAEDKFMQRFDDNGNFVNLPTPLIAEEMENFDNPFFTGNLNVVYHYVPTQVDDIAIFSGDNEDQQTDTTPK